MTSESDIDNNSGGSVWNGLLPSVTYTLASPPAISRPVSTPPTGKTETTQPPAAVTPTTTTTPKATVKPTASLTVMVTNSQGKPVVGAKVVLDNYYSEYTSTHGTVGFSGIRSGSHTLTVSAAGQKTSETTLILTPSQNKQMTVELKSTTNDSSVIVVLSLATILVLGAAFWYFKLSHPSNHTSPSPTISPNVTTPGE
jgi:hypothetical protein